MTDYQYLKNYQNDEELMESYFSLTQKVFSFDLKNWRSAGYWKDKYIAHSIILDNKVVANISVSIMQVQINGKEIPAVQLGSVCVLPEHRGKGLSKVLMERVFEEYKNYTLIFLFASDDVSEFYQKFGFRRVEEKLPFINVEDNHNSAEALKMPISSEKINKLLSSKLQGSSIIDARSNSSIYWFHLMYNFSKNIYYIEEKDVIFIAAYKDDIVDVYDILSEKEITFEEIKNYIIKDKTRKVLFHFTPDWLKVSYDVMPIENNALYAYGEFLLDMKNCKFPETAIT